MKRISKDVSLSENYTNHCLRATVITNLGAVGFEARHIKAIYGHKSDETIKSYAVRCPDKKKKEMSDALSTHLDNPPVKPQEKQEADVPQDMQFGTINFKDIVDFVPISNNADNFDIHNILNEVVTEQKPVEERNQVDLVASAATVPSAQQNIPQMYNPNIAVTPPQMANSKTLNVTRANGFPLISQMYFPHSSVTINYNINNAKSRLMPVHSK